MQYLVWVNGLEWDIFSQRITKNFTLEIIKSEETMWLLILKLGVVQTVRDYNTFSGWIWHLGKLTNITIVQVYTPTTDTEEEIENLCKCPWGNGSQNVIGYAAAFFLFHVKCITVQLNIT